MTRCFMPSDFETNKRTKTAFFWSFCVFWLESSKSHIFSLSLFRAAVFLTATVILLRHCHPKPTASSTLVNCHCIFSYTRVIIDPLLQQRTFSYRHSSSFICPYVVIKSFSFSPFPKLIRPLGNYRLYFVVTIGSGGSEACLLIVSGVWPTEVSAFFVSNRTFTESTYCFSAQITITLSDRRTREGYMRRRNSSPVMTALKMNTQTAQEENAAV